MKKEIVHLRSIITNFKQIVQSHVQCLNTAPQPMVKLVMDLKMASPSDFDGDRMKG